MTQSVWHIYGSNDHPIVTTIINSTDSSHIRNGDASASIKEFRELFIELFADNTFSVVSIDYPAIVITQHGIYLAVIVRGQKNKIKLRWKHRGDKNKIVIYPACEIHSSVVIVLSREPFYLAVTHKVGNSLVYLIVKYILCTIGYLSYIMFITAYNAKISIVAQCTKLYKPLSENILLIKHSKFTLWRISRIIFRIVLIAHYKLGSVLHFLHKGSHILVCFRIYGRAKLSLFLKCIHTAVIAGTRIHKQTSNEQH